MGDRYIITVICPKCFFVADNVYYAPTCNYTTWSCPECNSVYEIVERFELIHLEKKDKEN